MRLPTIKGTMPQGLSATDHLRRLLLSMAQSLQEMPHDEHIRKHPHTVALRATMHTIGMSLAEILEHPEDEHEARLNALLNRVTSKLNEQEIPETYSIEQSTPKHVVQLTTQHLLADISAITNQLELDRIAEAFGGEAM